MAHAEMRRRLPASITVPRVKTLPVYDRQGNVLIHRRRASRSSRVLAEYCMVDYEGVDPRIAEKREKAWRDLYSLHLAFLDVMPGFPLTKWKVVSRGLTDVCESLTR